MLKITNLSVEVDNKKILNKFNLNINLGEVHAIMGPNGIGKSTICRTIMGDPKYIVTSGNIIFDSKDLLKMNVTDRAQAGIYLLNQNPIEIPGVTNAEMLRLSLSEKTGTNVSIFEFNQKMENICDMLDIPKSFIHRGINEGMSGGERKKNELLHLWMLEPKLIILDELDSGLDVDSLKIVCQSINEYMTTHKCSILLISHHAELLSLLNVTDVHVMSEGTIVKSGDYNLALDIEKNGYKAYSSTNKVSDN
jgi:Fe-S cluster assembly ATP-binding protein